jgi:L-methionine (R)-S-oxide reductase
MSALFAAQPPVFNDPAYNDYFASAQQVLASEHTLPYKLFAVCRVLNERVPHYDWTGFYWVHPTEPRTLVLGAYEGAATDHTEIPFGRGICGQVAESGTALWIDDVTLQANYLACSLTTRAEVVLPIYVNGVMVGQLDIDSHTLNPFTPDDHLLLEAICTSVGALMAAGAVPVGR